MTDAPLGAPPQPPAAPGRRPFSRWLIRLAVVLVVVAAIAAGGLVVGENQTSKPSFCASCHIMVPYYESWHADIHGKKLDVACVDCHYAPGEKSTFKAKFRGLSQVTSYFSGRYGATRPRAHVSNDSCMTAKCHGDQAFMDKPLLLGTVRFTHANHLQRSAEQEQPNQDRLVELAGRLQTLVGKDHFADLESVAKQSGPAKSRYSRLTTLCSKWGVDVERDDLVEFSQLHHRSVRISQLQDLQCTNCHSYAAPIDAVADGKPAHHFGVSTTTCYTCHFNNESFNTGTMECLSCHTLPTGEITVHQQLDAEAVERLKSPELARATVTMDHKMILERNVDCVACHADVASEDSTVTRRDCERCHDQPRFFADWSTPFSVDQVKHYHHVHVDQQRAKCLDCHSEIHHQLVRETDVASDASFLSSSMSDCKHCHPNHHAEQIDLLQGRGGLGVEKGEPNLMFGSRTNCYGCHTKTGEDKKGTQVAEATKSGCIACHGERYGKMFDQWKMGVELSLTDAEDAFAAAKKTVEENQTATAEARAEAAKLLAVAEADLNLVKRANGIHNMTYSIDLLDSVTAHSQQAIAALSAK